MIALMLAAVATPPIPAAAAVTIEDVRRDPRAWDGKWVQLEGWINRCWSTDCTIAEKFRREPTPRG